MKQSNTSVVLASYLHKTLSSFRIAGGTVKHRPKHKTLSAKSEGFRFLCRVEVLYGPYDQVSSESLTSEADDQGQLSQIAAR